MNKALPSAARAKHFRSQVPLSHALSAGDSGTNIAPPNSMDRSSGFNLTELVVVMALFAVIIAIATPGLRTMMRDYEMRTSVSKLSAQIRVARYMAIVQKANYRVLVRGVQPGDSPATCVTFKETDGDGIYRAQSGSFSFPTGIDVESGSAEQIDFSPHGTCTTVPALAHSVIFKQQAGTSYKLTIAPGCLITVAKVQGES
jgi:prepilin-type N-terminal cleavage/methylation domain-containing protein